jgi:transposase InsO family protein
MALRVKTMAELRLELLLEVARSGETVAEVCRRHDISRKTYYAYLRRYEREGIDGLEPRSRRPNRSPARMPDGLELEICRLRKDHPKWGARRIRAELLRAGLIPPALSTVHQALVRNHLVAPQGPRVVKATRRFEWEAPNDLWQIDATRFLLDRDEVAWVMDMVDDHARFCLAARAGTSPSGEAAWACFEWAVARYGLPKRVLSDNGTCFTGRLIGTEVEFERRLRALGVTPVHARPYHPQTCGKLERFHRTMKDWMADRPRPRRLEDLQDLLDQFRDHYNHDRPHQGIGDATPAERYPAPMTTSPVAMGPGQEQPTYPPGSMVRKVNANGVIGVRGHQVGVGMRWKHLRVRVVDLAGITHIYFGEELIRSLVIDPDIDFQRSRSGPPTAKPRKMKGGV